MHFFLNYKAAMCRFIVSVYISNLTYHRIASKQIQWHSFDSIRSNKILLNVKLSENIGIDNNDELFGYLYIPLWIPKDFHLDD